jgi:hypothetical protein
MLTVIWWRDIPAQVTARRGEHVVRRELSPQFQVAIDRAAMHAGLIGTDAYLDEWRKVTTPCDEDLQTAVDAVAADLEETYPATRLARVAGNLGYEEQP